MVTMKPKGEILINLKRLVLEVLQVLVKTTHETKYPRENSILSLYYINIFILMITHNFENVL
jgi:hypothetical protein